MRNSLAELLDLKIGNVRLTHTNVRRKLFYYANREYDLGERLNAEMDAFHWPTAELIPILQAVLLDAEAYLWWLEQLAIVTNGHYTSPMEITEEVAMLVLDNRLDKLTSDQLRHLATSPGQLMQMFWEINESDAAAWEEIKAKIGEELLAAEVPGTGFERQKDDDVESDSPESEDDGPTIEKQESSIFENTARLQVAAGGGAKSYDAQKTVWQWKNSEIQAECVFRAQHYELKIKLLSESETTGPDQIEIYWVKVDKTRFVDVLKTSGQIWPRKLTRFSLPLGEKELHPDRIVLKISRLLDGVERVFRFELPLN